MPRSSNIYRRGATWWARVTVAGREHRRSLRTGDAAVARRRAEEWRARLIAETVFGDQRVTWEEAVILWSAEITNQVGPKTAQRYAVSLGQIEAHLRGLYIDQIDKAVVSAIVTARRATGVSTATIRRDLGALSSVLAYCEDRHDLDGNPALARLKKLREKREPIMLPEPADIERVIARAPGALAAMIRFAWQTGCRLDEMATAERRNVDWTRGQLTIVGKGRKLRVIPLTPDAVATLRMIPAAIASRWLFHHGGDAYRNVSSRFAELCRSAQKSAQQDGTAFRRFRFHDLRHRFAVDYLKKGGNLYDLQGILGHSSVKTTELYLTYLTPEESKAAKFGAGQNAAQTIAVSSSRKAGI